MFPEAAHEIGFFTTFTTFSTSYSDCIGRLGLGNFHITSYTLERRRCVCRFLLVPLLGPHGKFTISNLGVESSTNININCRLLFYNEICTLYFVNTPFIHSFSFNTNYLIDKLRRFWPLFCYLLIMIHVLSYEEKAVLWTL